MPVDVPRNPHPDCVGDRRHDVDRPGRRTSDPAALLVRKLDEQRHIGDVLKVGIRQRSPLLPRPEADAVVGGHDDERAVVEAGPPESGDEPSEHAVGVAELEQVPLPVLVDRGLVAVPDLVGPPARRLPDRVAAARGQVLPGAVGEHEVHVPERVAPTWPKRPTKAGSSLPGSGSRLRPGKTVPAVCDRRNSAGQVVRKQLMQVDDAGVLGEAAHSTAGRAFEAGAELGGQRWVSSSTTCRSDAPPTRVKRFWRWSV